MTTLRKVVLDTNVLLYDPDVIDELKNSEIIIPIVVLDELDVKKEKDSEIGRNARRVIRRLDVLRGAGSLHKGVDLNNGSRLKIEINKGQSLEGLSDDKTDNQILSVAVEENKKFKDVVLISKDINLRVKSESLGITAEDYKKSDVNDIVDVYAGWCDWEIGEEEVDRLHSDGVIECDEKFHNNEFVIAKNGKQSALGMYKNKRVEIIHDHKRTFGIKPKNKEQKFALSLLMDPKIKLITLTGSSGTGKTLLSLAAGLEQTLNSKEYMRLVISKPNQPMGGKARELGFLPGNIDEKMEPWIAPFRDNLEYIFGDTSYDKYMADDKISIEALTYIRGRSIPNSFIIIDECQNLMPKEIKAIVTRVGFGSKLVLLGDISQIDNIFLDFATNGLTATIEAFKGESVYGHVTFMKGERSDLATLASRIL